MSFPRQTCSRHLIINTRHSYYWAKQLRLRKKMRISSVADTRNYISTPPAIMSSNARAHTSVRLYLCMSVCTFVQKTSWPNNDLATGSFAQKRRRMRTVNIATKHVTVESLRETVIGATGRTQYTHTHTNTFTLYYSLGH